MISSIVVTNFPRIDIIFIMHDMVRDFTNWAPFMSRKEREGLDLSCSGVYMLGYFPKNKPRKPVVSNSIIYIGETCGQKLCGRLEQFERSAKNGTGGHSGGITFSKKYGRSELSFLYLSVLGVSLGEVKSPAYIRYVERALLWQYVQKNNRLPACNKK